MDNKCVSEKNYIQKLIPAVKTCLATAIALCDGNKKQAPQAPISVAPAATNAFTMIALFIPTPGAPLTLNQIIIIKEMVSSDMCIAQNNASY